MADEVEVAARPPDAPALLTIEHVIADLQARNGFRAGGTKQTQTDQLGLLGEFPGNWRGAGFNLIARPFFGADPAFFLELNTTQETLDFRAVSGQVPNRGSQQPDLFLNALHYLQQVTDVKTDTGIHIETGMWLHVPATNVPQAGESYVRQSTIPHGDSLLAQTTFFVDAPGGPTINTVDSTPFTGITPALNASSATPLTNPAYLAQYKNSSIPKGLPPGLVATDVIKDPTQVLRANIAHQNIINTVVLSISTASPGNLINIPFVQSNANATQLDAIFWIETVLLPGGRVFLQLQYVQRVILEFLPAPDGNGKIKWPHISVATLKRL